MCFRLGSEVLPLYPHYPFSRMAQMRPVKRKSSTLRDPVGETTGSAIREGD